MWLKGRSLAITLTDAGWIAAGAGALPAAAWAAAR
jgi:hypothetical protein